MINAPAKISPILPGSQYAQDKKRGFPGAAPNKNNEGLTKNAEPRREMLPQQIKIEAMAIAAQALAHIPIPNITDHSYKVIQMSRTIEQELLSKSL